MPLLLIILDKMKEFLVGWADRHNIAVKVDAVGNVMMSKPATWVMRMLRQ